MKFFFGDHNQKQIDAVVPLVDKINQIYTDRSTLSETQIQEKTEEFRARILAGESLDDILPEAFATVKLACKAMVGKKFSVKGDMRERNMIPYDVQLIGGIMLHQGKIAEMKTGEGKTLVAALPTYLNALTGKGVHVVTVNDYLASRDAEWMGHLYAFLGLRVGCVVKGVPPHERRSQYGADITYVENAELGFDFLRDNLVKEMSARSVLQRPMYYAIVDEVDSILIDEARTPLIISEPDAAPTDKYEYYAKIVQTLIVSHGKKKVSKGFLHDFINRGEDADTDNVVQGDYYVDEKTKSAILSSQGITKLETMLGVENLYSDLGYEEIHYIENALKAMSCYHKDKEYIIQNNQVVIIDDNTGRAMQGRRFSEGLHQAIEAKEQVTIQRESKTLATVTYQNFFKNYEKLAGMTGTAMTEAEEFEKIYERDTVSIPTNKPTIRVDKNDKVYLDQATKRKKIAEDISFANRMGQPILIGTSSIQTSEFVSTLLQKKSIIHTVLNAKFHEKEASIVANAGKKGSVVVATNMAGRGTDIQLDPLLNKQIAINYIQRIQSKGREKDLAQHKSKSSNHIKESENVGLSLVLFSDGERSLFWSTRSQEMKWNQSTLDTMTTGEYIENGLHYSVQLTPKKNIATQGYITVYITSHDQTHVRYTRELYFGLFILGTEKHESRRIDNQLRGRAGRQGDPGISVFYVALDDTLMRKMGGDKMQSIARFLLPKDHLEDLELTQSQFTDAIIRSQKQMESYLFSIRKHLFEYDSVIDKQRKSIYSKRDVLLSYTDADAYSEANRQSLREELWSFVGDVVDEHIFVAQSSPEPLVHIQHVLQEQYNIAVDIDVIPSEKSAMKKYLAENITRALEKNVEQGHSDIWFYGVTNMYLHAIDTHRVAHIDDMHRLREKVGLMGYAQIDPLVVYKKEAYEKYQKLLLTIKSHTLHLYCTTRFVSKNQNLTEEESNQDGSIMQKLQSIAKGITIKPHQKTTQNQNTVAGLTNGSDEFEIFEGSDDNTSTKSIQPMDLSTRKKLRPNDKVTVRYKNGTMEYDVKYKKIQQDIESGDCEIVS